VCPSRFNEKKNRRTVKNSRAQKSDFDYFVFFHLQNNYFLQVNVTAVSGLYLKIMVHLKHYEIWNQLHVYNNFQKLKIWVQRDL